jgi:1,4-alpha-glucan branching enzyme
MDKNVISFVFNANLPFVREIKPHFVDEELPLFETVSFSFIPFLQMLDRLEAEHIPFRITLVMPPVLCHLLTDELLINRYLEYVDNQIAFGEKEMTRCKDNPKLLKLVYKYYEDAIDKRVLFTERYNKNIPAALYNHTRRGKLEIITTAAANAYLPFYINYPSAIAAQIETALIAHRNFFRTRPQGFWPPELAWCDNLDNLLHWYKFDWAVIDTHTALLSRILPEDGTFYPLKTQAGLFLLTKDFYAYQDIMSRKTGLPLNNAFRSYFDDAGFDLPHEYVINFISENGMRLATGYKYYTKGQNGKNKEIYHIEKANIAAKQAAKQFLSNRAQSLFEAQKEIHKNTISVCALPFSFFGHFWYEGWTFIEEIFREGAQHPDIQFLTPSEYLRKKNSDEFSVIAPEYSSSGYNGYAETYLGSSNDGIFRHILRSIERMIELSERFSDETDVRERVLNQAAREILLSTQADWLRITANAELNISSEWRNYAQNKLELHLRNFTTLYESLGSAHLSTRFLTDLEAKDNVFPDINYRSFRRKRKFEFNRKK